MRQRRSFDVRGVVQGVGFRPFVFTLAERLGLGGFVRNELGRVHVEVEGEPESLRAFAEALTHQPPPLARIQHLESRETPVLGEQQFRIDPSQDAGSEAIFISPDVATCDACLRELRDPADRRYRHPFINCTHCGPRLTLITGAPYDRPLTTMAGFPLCAACRAEYDDPRDRRFHAQPIACPSCGPALRLLDRGGTAIDDEDPIRAAAARLRAGEIGAIKGIGGFHLACDAQSEAAVDALRARKHREQKPFALMVRDLAAAEALCELTDAERAQLLGAARPIVLARARAGARVAEAVAPGADLLGVMLPYAPLHHLLFDLLGDLPLVMTSANRADEPIAFRDDEALAQLHGIADFFVVHDRPIHTRCDDSVVRVVDGTAVPFRRSRGHAPAPLRLPQPLARPTLALGGQLKGCFALATEDRAFVSHHLGDLDQPAALASYQEAIAHYERLFRIHPERVVHDLHPDYASTRLAIALERQASVKLLGVQHHHAHFAACMAEHALTGTALGLIFDGAGLGTDGTIWGGELLLGGPAGFQRIGNLAPVRMPGASHAMREPWRMAVSHAFAAGLEVQPLMGRLGEERVRVARQMIDRGFNAPITSSVGRLFDAVAWLSGIADAVSFEGQAAIALEAAAARSDDDGAYEFELRVENGRQVLDPRPMLHALMHDVDRGIGREHLARRFHLGLAAAATQACCSAREQHGVDRVVLSGGVFMNALLSSELCARLTAKAFSVYRHRQVPPNDGGLCFGQLAIAASHDGSA